MTRREIAVDYFNKGYNCCQAVLLAFQDLTGLDTESSALLASSFGGGMGKLREVCGAVSGMFMAIGMISGYSDPNDPDAKAAHYKCIQELAAQFKDKNGSYICRELLSGKFSGRDPISVAEISPNTPPAPRTAEYYKKRPCGELVGDAAEILSEYLKNI